MIDGTFAFIQGIGPARERELYRLGIRGWDDFPAEGPVVAPLLDTRIRDGIAAMRPLVEGQRWEEILAKLPVREHWRLLPHIEEIATFLDIETAANGSITVIGLYDEAGGPRLYVRGHNLGQFMHERPRAVVTFNGGSFDLPELEKAFPGWRPPLHVDLRTVMRQLRERGGLKMLEERFGIGRPEHLKGLNGGDAVGLWQRFRNQGDVNALARLLEYNLYDAVQLRSLAQLTCERLARRGGREWAPNKRFERGDVLFDITRAVQAVVASARGIVAEEFHPEERRSLRAGRYA